MTEFKKAAADTARDMKKSMEPNDSSASKPSSDKTVLESVSMTLSSKLACYVCMPWSLLVCDHMHHPWAKGLTVIAWQY